MTLRKSDDHMAETLPFMRYEATNQLRQLALHPIDFTRPGQLTPERLVHYVAEACGYQLLYGTERVTDEVMKALEDLAKESKALDKMKRMQEGEDHEFYQTLSF